MEKQIEARQEWVPFDGDWVQLISDDTYTTFRRNSDGKIFRCFWDERENLLLSNSFGGYSRGGTTIYGRPSAKTLNKETGNGNWNGKMSQSGQFTQ